MSGDKPQTVEEFLAMGGKIESVPFGATGIDQEYGIPKQQLKRLRAKYSEEDLPVIINRLKHFGVACE